MKLADLAKIVLVFGLFLWGHQGIGVVSDELSSEAAAVSRLSPDELQHALVPYLQAWGARDEGRLAWASLPLAPDAIDEQAPTVMAIIQAHHASHLQRCDRLPVALQAVLQAAVTIASPYRVFYESQQPAHPLLAGTSVEALYVQLEESHPGKGYGDALKAAMRAVWRDYTGRTDLSAMVGEEAPGPLEIWLFSEAISQRAKAVKADLTIVCPAAYRPVWACQSSFEGRVETLCLGGGAARMVQFRTIIPGEAPSWTLPDTPTPATEVMDFWVNDETLVSKISKGRQSLIMMKSDGPMGTDGRVSSEYNMNPGRPRDCKILSDSIGYHFADLIPCEDRFDAASCPFSYILPFSNRRAIKPHELRGFSEIQLELAQTEILVRHGQQLYGDEAIVHFGTRAWVKGAIGDVSLRVLSPVERTNFQFILEQIQLYRAPDSAQWRLPAAGGHWQGEVIFAGGRRGTLAGADHRMRFTPADGGWGWLYLPRHAEVYMHEERGGQGAIEPDWRTPWLLPTDVLKALNVKVMNDREASIAKAGARCFTLTGRKKDYGDIKGNDLWLSGEVCLTRDGIPVKMDLKGGHELEGQDEVMPWEFSFEMTTLRRAIQPEATFIPPESITWNRPG